MFQDIFPYPELTDEPDSSNKDFVCWRKYILKKNGLLDLSIIGWRPITKKSSIIDRVSSFLNKEGRICNTIT